jgi:hypothetical protein
MSIWQNYMKITAIILLILLISCNVSEIETDKARQDTKSNKIKNGDIFTDLDIFWEKINSFDTSLQREEYIKSLLGKSVAWKLYVSDVVQGTELDPKYNYLAHVYIPNYTIYLTRYSEGSVDLGAPNFTTLDKKFALAFRKGNRVTLKGTFDGIFVTPTVDKPILVNGWE